MFECKHCDVSFETKKLLSLHQRSKKCTVHRTIIFKCKKCLNETNGYDNAIKHSVVCTSEEPDVLSNIINQFKKFYTVNVTGDCLTFQKMNNYDQPPLLEKGPSVPNKNSRFLSLSNTNIKGNLTSYLSDVKFQTAMLGDAIQIIAYLYPWNEFVDTLWFDSASSIFYIKDNVFHVLTKTQCQDENGKTWFGNAFDLKKGERVTKCVWTKDPELKITFGHIRECLKDLVNLYLAMGKVENCHLAENIKNLSCYQTFYETFSRKIKQTDPFTNIEYVFDEPQSGGYELQVDVMCLCDPPTIKKGSFYRLMARILPPQEQIILKAKLGL
jgi:hypothetical protein